MFLVLLVLLLFVGCSGRDSWNIQNSLTLNCETILQMKVPSWQDLPLALTLPNVSVTTFMGFVVWLLFFFFFFPLTSRYIMVPSGNMGVFDPTEIHNRGQLKSHMKEAMIKLGFHLLCFFMYLYRLVSKIAPKEQRDCLPAIFISSNPLV